MVGRAISSNVAAPSQSRLRRDSAKLVWLTAASIVSRRRQNVLSCGLPPISIIVAQGPYQFDMTSLLSGCDYLLAGYFGAFGSPFASSAAFIALS